MSFDGSIAMKMGWKVPDFECQNHSCHHKCSLTHTNETTFVKLTDFVAVCTMAFHLHNFDALKTKHEALKRLLSNEVADLCISGGERLVELGLSEEVRSNPLFACPAHICP